MRVAITGARGFIGSCLVKQLLAEGIEVLQIGRCEEIGPRAGGNIFNVSAESLYGCDALVHAAGLAHRTSGQRPTEADYVVANRDATKEIATLASEACVKRVVFLSSIGVLGNDSGSGRFSEVSVPAPYDAYTRSKRLAELSLEQTLVGSATTWVILRLPMVVGVNAPGNWSRLVQWVRAGRWVLLPRTEGTRSYLSVDSVCAFAKAAIVNRSLCGTILNLADGPDLTASELARCVADGCGCNARILTIWNWVLMVLLFSAGRGADWQRLSASLRVDPAGARRLAGIDGAIDIRSVVEVAAKYTLAKGAAQ